MFALPLFIQTTQPLLSLAHRLPFNSHGTIFPHCYSGGCTETALLLLHLLGSIEGLGKISVIYAMQLEMWPVNSLFPGRPVSFGRGILALKWGWLWKQSSFNFSFYTVLLDLFFCFVERILWPTITRISAHLLIKPLCEYLKIKTSSTFPPTCNHPQGISVCVCVCVCDSTVTPWFAQGLRNKSLSETHPRFLILVSDQKAFFIICTMCQDIRTEPLGFFARCFLSFLMPLIKPASQKLHRFI